MYLVECKPDEVLVKSLTLTSRKNIQHAGNKSQLLKKLTEQFSNSKALIDEDPGSIQPPSLQKFREKQDLTSYRLKILRQKSRNNTLIILRPRLEEWILEAAKEAKIDPRKYNLPKDPTQLHEQINMQIDQFQKLVKDLVITKRVRKLKTHLTTSMRMS
jgi:hypothetical protein